MKLQQLNGFAFDTETNVLGAIASVDFLKQTVTILTDEDEQVVAKLDNVKFLEQIGYIGNNGIINHDVVTTADGTLYEIVLQEDGQNVQLHVLGNKLERIEAGDVIAKTDLTVLEPYVTFVGNINELEPVALVDFNIKVVRSQLFHEDITYFYACNNAELEEVDLIKVVFVGHQLLEETAYERFTLTHEQYVEAVEGGTITETTPQNLMNYITGLTYGVSSRFETEEFEEEYYEDEDEVEDEEVSEDCDCIDCRLAREDEVDSCEDCGEDEEDCECNDW